MPTPALYVPPPKPKPVVAQTKRKGFFSFHYDDIIRVNNVRNAWKINCPGREDKRQFYDRSLWELVKRKNPEGLKSRFSVEWSTLPSSACRGHPHMEPTVGKV